MTWPCFWVEETGDVEVSLRRYKSAHDPCAAGGTYHNTSVPIGRQRAVRSAEGYLGALHVADYADRTEWPTVCACGYVFAAADEWQVNQEPVYADRATRREWRDRSLPPGAMFDSAWSRPWGVGADGIALMVVLPPESADSRSHWWHVDGPSRNNGKSKPNAWTRTGDPHDPPTLNVNPSILTPDYHGWLHDGVLSDPI